MKAAVAPRIVPGSEEQDVHGLLLLGETTAMAISSALCIDVERVRKMLSRLRAGGFATVRYLDAHRRAWRAGSGKRGKSAADGHIGIGSAMRRLFESGGEYSAADMAQRFGISLRLAATSIVTLVNGRYIVRCSAMGDAAHVRYKARAKDNVRHLYGFVEGPGERRDCANYEWCLEQFNGDGDAHCAANCAGFQVIPVERLRAEAQIRRRSVFDG